MEAREFIGACKLMCPEAEIKLRERENLLHPFEVSWDSCKQRRRADVSKMVKEYRRPTVGKDENNPADVRPPCILRQTVDYLIDSIATQDTAWPEIYDFMFDRLRAVRQDLVIQHCGGEDSIEILEKVVRFLIYSDYRLCTEHISVFDSKINSQHIQECLKRLLNFYRYSEKVFQNRVEFESIYILFNLGDMDALKHYFSLDRYLRKSPVLQRAYEISISCLLGNWVRLIKVMKKLKSPLLLCAVHRHFPLIQRKIIQSMNLAYSSKICKFPISRLTDILCCNTDTETQRMCQQFGLSILGTNVQFLKGSFQDTNLILILCCNTDTETQIVCQQFGLSILGTNVQFLKGSFQDSNLARQHLDFITTAVRRKSIPDILHGSVNIDEDICENLQDYCKT